MLRKISILIEKFWSNYFPSRQLLLKTGSDTKFFTLSSSTQAIIIFALFVFVGWSLFSSLIFTFKALNLGVKEDYFARSYKQKSGRQIQQYEKRLRPVACSQQIK